VSTAVFTFVFNESVNLPIWSRYFGALFGPENLFVIDRSSTDGSTASLGGGINRMILPPRPFDEFEKTGFINSFHRALLYHYDTVIYTDCDELIVPDLQVHENLVAYLRNSDFDYVTCVGLNVHHMITLEAPLDLDAPILAQRRYARFGSPSCKSLISRVPLTWRPGIHSCDRPPNIDPALFLFHLKLMDYTVAMRRQGVNLATQWSSRSLEENHGTHHRYDYDQFVREGFLDPVNQLRKGTAPFDFVREIEQIQDQTREHDGFFYIPMNIYSLVEIPEHLRSAF
jgi:hypothetical protein